MEPKNLLFARYDAFRRGGKLLGRLAIAVQFGFLLLGLYLFLDQSRDLISDAQFTWGERRVMAIVAVITLGGCAFAGWILGQLFRISAGVIDLLADGAESAARTNELIQQHLVPILGRIAAVLEEQPKGQGSNTPPISSSMGPDALKAELTTAQAAGRVARAFEVRDALTRHVRGESLHQLDRDLALWLLNLVERRVQAGTVDPQVAGWVTRALDSFGEMQEAAPLRQALAGIRRQAGLCVRCGGALPSAARGTEGICSACKLELHEKSSRRNPGPRPASLRDST